jgi:hypothetical protein
MKSSYGYNPCLDNEDLGSKISSPYIQMLNVPTLKLTENMSSKASEHCESSRTLKDDINNYMSSSRDFTIFHQKVHEQKPSLSSEGYGVISSLNTSISKKHESLERPISEEPFGEIDINKMHDLSSRHTKGRSEAYTDSTHDKDSETSVKNSKASIDQNDSRNSVCMCCKNCKQDKLKTRKLLNSKEYYILNSKPSSKKVSDGPLGIQLSDCNINEVPISTSNVIKVDRQMHIKPVKSVKRSHLKKYLKNSRNKTKLKNKNLTNADVSVGQISRPKNVSSELDGTCGNYF